MAGFQVISHGRSWVFTDEEEEADQTLLMQAPNELLVLSNECPLQGSLFNQILVYLRKKSN